MYHIIAICVLLIQSSLSFSTDWSDEFDYETYLDEDNLFKLYWTVLEDDMIEFGIEAAATGWIALGVSPRAQMPNSDIAIGWVDDDGNAFIQDRYTEGRTAPLYDAQQNLTLIEGEEADGMTRLRFIRPKYTCDDQDLSIVQGTSRLLWAFHETLDPTEECFDGNSIQYHTNKGTQSLNLDSGIPEEIELEDDVEYIDFLMDEVHVPSSDTTYYCKLFEIPQLAETNDTQHIVKFETIVEEGNEALVHHIVVYDCPEWIAEWDADVYEGDCDNETINMPSRYCRAASIRYVWAIGGNDVYLPEIAGLPVSGESDHHYFLIEMHYDNPNEESGLIDSSGFRMYYTPTLRELEASVLTFGTSTNTMGQWIPPGINYAHNSAIVPAECTNATFPEDGIKVFGSFLHQHTIGIASKLRHIRDGVELEPVDLNLDYDFNYQQIIMFEDPIVLLPGDEFILDCWTNSSLRTEATTGGEASSQEMCFVFLYYYPAVDFNGAFTQKTKQALGQWMVDAQESGYLSGTADEVWLAVNKSSYDNDPDLSGFDFDGSLDGAEDFYDRLWSVDYPQYNEHNLFCTTQATDTGFGTLINANPYNVSRNESFEAYDDSSDDCPDTDDDEDSAVGQCVPTSFTSTAMIDNSEDIASIDKASTILKVYVLIWTFIILVSFM